MHNEPIQNLNQSTQKKKKLSRLGMLSVILAFIFVVPVLSGLAAIMFGIISLYSIVVYKNELRGKGFAITGIVVGIGQLLAVIVLLLAAISVLGFGMPNRLAYLNFHRLSSSPKKYYDYLVKQNEFVSQNNRAYSLRKRGKLQESLKYYQTALNTAKKEIAITYYGMGEIYMSQKQYEKAIGTFDKAIAYNPKFFDAYQNKAVTYRLMGRFQDSIDACKKTISLFPDFARAYCSMGWAYEYLGNYKEAINAHLKAIRLAPKWQFPRQRINYCLSKINDEEFKAKIRQIIGQK